MVFPRALLIEIDLRKGIDDHNEKEKEVKNQIFFFEESISFRISESNRNSTGEKCNHTIRLRDAQKAEERKFLSVIISFLS